MPVLTDQNGRSLSCFVDTAGGRSAVSDAAKVVGKRLL